VSATVAAGIDIDSVTVTWGVPFSDGGSPITSYTVTPFNGSIALTPVTVTSGTSATVTGLTPGTFYTFTVSATNAIGTGPAPASNAVTTIGPSPANTQNTAIPLDSLGCGLSITATSSSGTTANDGSNAWFVVSFAGPAAIVNPSCTLQISLTGPGGGVFDVYRGSDPMPFASGVTSITENSPGLGASEQLYIRVYDKTPPASQGGINESGMFSLNLHTQ
jgi:Fibronectin type III domain